MGTIDIEWCINVQTLPPVLAIKDLGTMSAKTSGIGHGLIQGFLDIRWVNNGEFGSSPSLSFTFRQTLHPSYFHVSNVIEALKYFRPVCASSTSIQPQGQVFRLSVIDISPSLHLTDALINYLLLLVTRSDTLNPGQQPIIC